MGRDPYRYFRVEARELVEELGKGVMGLERGDPAAEAVPRLLRLAHTLKGAARVVRQGEIADLSHRIEDELARLRDEGAPAARDRLDGLLGLVDAIGTRLATLTPAPEAAGPGRAPLPAEVPFRTLRTDVGEVDALLDGIAETQAGVVSLRAAVASLGRARRLASELASPAAAPRGREGQRKGDGGPGSRAARQAEELEARVESAGGALVEGLDRLERELRQVREAAERLRLLPAEALFGPLERAVRDAARSTGNRAAFHGEGGEVRLDGHVLAALQSALVQVVRNAVAHGIEPEGEREAAGKAAEGAVVLEVSRRGGRIAFTCRDDGRGVDLDAVRRALERKGPVSTDTRGLGPERLLQLLLEGGISTSSAVTEVAGRGVGLDVVREAVSSLGGQVTVRTRAGEGTTLELVVPVSLSSLESLLVEGSTVTAAIPLAAVRRALRVGPEEITTAAGRASVEFEGRLIPFQPLTRVLGTAGPAERARRAWTGVVVSGAGGLAALGVERLLGTMNVLVRALPRLAPSEAVVGGVWLDAAGHPQIVLDADRLVTAARDAETDGPAARDSLPPILVVDDSLTTRMLEQSILESAGYTVELASSGEEALEKARRRRYGLFLVDIEMPGMDGFALVERLRAEPSLRDLPSILVTSRSSPEDRRRGEQAGARGYMAKSEFDQAELLERIRSLVG